ncbi:homeodomain transcription factor ste12 [Entomortierella chlamydospora]|uniref:Homeodomain transcription factor ste12 n=1 Tax=Entomortierella chlamydospora TaxID=101097 RepID=A0A9P6MIN3_9FUNG|nr:homeodomain transcription factor ste12 [Entomortierella chlamydospora]KAG0002791.1 homeodomain transcription factor ste12 [Entomortierella chlamydospora]
MELSKFLLPTGETISCVLWNELYHITGTDIVRSLVSRFESFGRPVRNIKKFEEGVFSDLRNLKPGADACLEEPKSPFLEMLYRNNCIRTQKKQKVFYWYSVPHDRLFLDAMERDLKREQAGTEPTSQAVAEPALSCTLETVRDLVERLSRRTIEMNTITETLQSFTPDGVAPMTRQLPTVISPLATSPTQAQLVPEGGMTTTNVTTAVNTRSDSNGSSFENRLGHSFIEDVGSDDNSESKVPTDREGVHLTGSEPLNHASDANAGLFGSFTLFEGSPTYKKRRRRSTANPSHLSEQIERHADIISNGGDAVLHSGSRNGSFDFDQDSSDRYLDGAHKGNGYPGGFHDSSRPLHHHGSSSISSMQSIHGGSSNSSRSYACPVQPCGRLFKRLEHLKRHWRTHTLERPYACNICSKRFSRSDNLAAHRKTHDKPSWANDDDSSAPRGDGEDDEIEGDDQDNDDPRISKGYTSDQSMTRKRPRMHRDRGMESMSERESISGLSSGDEDDDLNMASMMKLSSLTQEQQQLLQQHRQGFAKATTPMLQAQHPPFALSSQRPNVFPELASQNFMPTMSMIANQQYAPFSVGPLSAGFGGFLANQPMQQPPLFTLEEEEDENEEITDMEKLRYKYEYEIKAAIDSTPVLSEVTKMMATPYGAGAFGYGGAIPDYVAYNQYPLATPVGLGGRFPFDPTATAVASNTFATPMVPSSATSNGSFSTTPAAPSNYPVVHTAALPPSHHHQEYLEFTLGSMLPTI